MLYYDEFKEAIDRGYIKGSRRFGRAKRMVKR